MRAKYCVSMISEYGDRFRIRCCVALGKRPAAVRALEKAIRIRRSLPVPWNGRLHRSLVTITDRECERGCCVERVATKGGAK